METGLVTSVFSAAFHFSNDVQSWRQKNLDAQCFSEGGDVDVNFSYQLEGRDALKRNAILLLLEILAELVRDRVPKNKFLCHS